jgi:hypothetical protein
MVVTARDVNGDPLPNGLVVVAKVEEVITPGDWYRKYRPTGKKIYYRDGVKIKEEQDGVDLR